MKNPIIIVLFFYQIVCANSSVDSLESYLEVVSDSQKVEIYQELAAITFVDSFEQSIEYSEHAYVYAQLINDELQAANILFNIAQKYLNNGLNNISNEYFFKASHLYIKMKNHIKAALCYANMGSNCFLLYDFKNAIKFFKTAIDNCHLQKKLPQIEAVCLESIGSIHYLIGNVKKSLMYHRKAFDFYLVQNDSINIANIYYLIGADYSAVCSYDKSIEFYLKSLEIYEKKEHLMGVALINHAIGLVYEDFGFLDKSLEYNYRALKLMKNNDDAQLSASIYKWIGSIYSQKRNWHKASNYLYMALNIENGVEDKLGLITTLEKIGTLHYMRQKHEDAIRYYEKAFDYLKSVNDKWRKSKLLINIGKVYIELEQFAKALKLIKEGIKIANDIKIRDLVLDGYNYAAHCLTKMQSYKTALKYQILYTNLRDSIHYENSFKIADMQLRYETAKREKVNDILQKENRLQKVIIGKHKTQQWLLYASVMILSFLTIIGYFKFISKNKYGIKLYKRINKAMARHKEQEQSLIHLSALTKLGELAASIIHDLKQPLQDIKLSAEEIESGISNRNTDQKLIKSSLEDIFEDVERISSMADYVITCTNKKVYEKEIEFNVNQSIANAYRMIRKQLMRQEIMLNMDLEDNLPAVLGNPWKFEHVLLNIFSNSSHALNEIRKFNGGEFKENFVIETYSNMYNVFVRVKDNGIGVINSFKPKMFYPFATSKKPGEGTGLGLSIVYNVVRQMNGRLDFVSTPFVGTVITLIFPFASAKTIHHAKERTLLEEVENFSIR